MIKIEETVVCGWEAAIRGMIYFARKDHKLDEWHTFCDRILSLPYFKEICVED